MNANNKHSRSHSHKTKSKHVLSNKPTTDEELYALMLTHIKNIQPSAKKKIKRETYSLLLSFFNEYPITQECIDLLIKGDRSKHLIGICELTSKKTSTGNFKGSTLEYIKIIHDWMFLSNKSDQIITEFAINEEYIARMNLGEHYSVLSSSTKKENKQLSIKVIKIIHAIINKRPSLELNEFIREGFIEMIQKALNDYTLEQKKQEIKHKENIANDVEENVDEVIKEYNTEPKTWDDVEKSNKKLLTCEFLTSDNNNNNNTLIDEDKELEMELIDNFVDPLNNNAHLNIKAYTEDEVQQLHLQMERFDPVFFLEKLYSTISLDNFSQSVAQMNNNIDNDSINKEELIDKNIYKYLDCKKLLDTILDKFNTQTNALMTEFSAQSNSLQFAIKEKLTNIKGSFDIIMKSKQAKEVLLKFSKYFLMKDKIEHALKFSNYIELADDLKKVNNAIKEMSKDKLIYKDFYEYFVKHIDNFKSVLVNVIKVNGLNDKTLQYCKYLIEFDINEEILYELINYSKDKMCLKIKNYLKYTENFEISNYRLFFMEENDVIDNINDEMFLDIIQESEKYINKDNSYGDNNNNNSKQINNKNELINVENIITSLSSDINDFIITLKVIFDVINSKHKSLNNVIINEESENINDDLLLSPITQCNFDSTAKSIYNVLFTNLDMFLYNDTSFSFANIYKEYITDMFIEHKEFNINNNKYMSTLLQFYSSSNEIRNVIYNNNFNKNTILNTSNLIINIYDKFEYHFTQNVIDSLLENKIIFIRKMFIAFLNEKLMQSLQPFINENTINYVDTELSIFNYSSFEFTKSFIKQLTINYIDVIKFYMNIIKKVKDISLEHEMIYLSFFFVLKCFITRFIYFYLTEKKYTYDEYKLNCYIVETIRNYSYIKNEIPQLMKYLFKGKDKDYKAYIDDINVFIHSICKHIFMVEYISNSGNNINKLYLNLTMKVEDTKFSYYDKHNNELIIKDNNKKKQIFTDIRSCIIDIFTYVTYNIRHCELINEIECLFDVKDVICKVVNMFYNTFIMFYNENTNVFIEGNNAIMNGNTNLFLYVSQLYLEFEIFNTFIKDYIGSDKECNKSKDNMNKILISLLIKIKEDNLRNRSKISSQQEIFTKDELLRKQKLIETCIKNYSSFYNCFTLKKSKK